MFFVIIKDMCGGVRCEYSKKYTALLVTQVHVFFKQKHADKHLSKVTWRECSRKSSTIALSEGEVNVEC